MTYRLVPFFINFVVPVYISSLFGHVSVPFSWISALVEVLGYHVSPSHPGLSHGNRHFDFWPLALSQASTDFMELVGSKPTVLNLLSC